MKESRWKEFTNITKIEEHLYRPMNGIANELIAIGRIMKAGFFVARMDIREVPYDAIIVLNKDRSLKVQIKGSQTDTVSLTGGQRSGQQQKKGKDAVNKEYKYDKSHCDVLVAIDGTNGDCYIIPAEDLGRYKTQTSFKNLADYKEKWTVLKDHGSD